MSGLLDAPGDPSFRALLEAAPDALVIVNTDGQIVLVNAQAERVFGYPRDELLGERIELLVPARFHGSHAQWRQGYGMDPHPRPLRAGLALSARRKDGTEFPVEISLSPIQTPHGLLIASAIRDIRERLKAEDERNRLLQERATQAEASRIKDEFIATLSHELRTPLNAILGWATLLQDGVLPPDKTTNAIATIVRNAHAQIQLVEDLLDVSRIVTGKLNLRMQAMDLCEVIEHAVEVVRPAAAARQLSLEMYFEQRPAIMVGDADRLQQAVWNLLSNAVRFCNDRGRVEIRTVLEGGHVSVLVRDTGRGIDPKFLPHVFDRFRQADSSYTREHGGLGLGLALVKSIVELHGGSVGVSSSGLGSGAAFRLTLPTGVPTESPSRPLDRTGEASRLDDVGVLVVDDQPDERELLSTVMAAHGAAVVTAGSADEAVQSFKNRPPDLVVTDIAMPGGDGYSLLRRLRALPGVDRVVAIAVTAHARLEDRERAEAAGFDAYLSKPINRHQLVRMAAHLVSDRRPRR